MKKWKSALLSFLPTEIFGGFCCLFFKIWVIKPKESWSPFLMRVWIIELKFEFLKDSIQGWRSENLHCYRSCRSNGFSSPALKEVVLHCGFSSTHWRLGYTHSPSTKGPKTFRFCQKLVTEGPRLTCILGLGKKLCYMNFVLVGLYYGPLLTLIVVSTRRIDD